MNKHLFKRLVALLLAVMLILPASVITTVAEQDEGLLPYAQKMMDDYLAVYLRDHTNQTGQVVGKSTWRWSNNPDKGGGLTAETQRETDFWLSALIFDSVNDAYEFSGNEKYALLLSQLYDSFINSYYHPTWDVHTWTHNTYNDDLCWWIQAMLRAYNLTNDQKYLNIATAMFDAVWAGWDTTNANFGGTPYGGILWRRSAGGVTVNRSNNEKNVATNANASLCASRLAMLYKTSDPAKSADYLDKATRIYEWAYAHLYKDKTTGRMIDNISYNGNESASQFTYNYGLFADASYELYKLTGTASYLTDAKKVLNYGWTTLTLSDGLTVKDEGQSDTAGFKLVLARLTGYMVQHGEMGEFKKYLDANAYQAYKHRRASDGICGTNLSFTPKDGAGIAGPCAVLGPVLLFYSGIDPTVDTGYVLNDLADPVNGVYQAEFALNDYIQFDSGTTGYQGAGYSQYWDADGPHQKDGYILFQVNAPEDGIYKLTFRWYTRGNNTRRLSINGSPDVKLNFDRTAANRWENLDYYALLQKGSNTVKLTYYNGYSHGTDRDTDSWCFIDYLAVDEQHPWPAPQQSSTANVAYEGDYTSGWNGNAIGQYVDFKVEVPKSGVYTLNFFYGNNSGSVSSRELTVNGYEEKQLIAFPMIGPGWNHSSVVQVPDIALNAGENTIKLANNTAKGTAQYINLLKYVGVTQQYSVQGGDEMMEDFLAAYLREHYDEDGNVAGLSTWRWSDNTDKGGGSTYEKRRETDFWLSALILDTVNDALEYSKNPKYITIIDGLYESFIKSQWHPTWDVHDWMVNTYTDDLCWWAQSFERSYRLTGDSKYLDTATDMWDEIMKSWDETPGYGGEPYGGFFWRRTAGDNVVNPTNASKNVCSNLNSCIVAARLSKDFAGIDAEKSASYANQAKKGFAWAKAHLLRADGYIYDNVNYSGGRSTGQYTYNYGNFAGAAYELYTVTGEQEYMDTCLLVLRYALSLTKEGTKFVQADGMTVTGSEGTGDGSGFKMILLRQMASIVYDGGITEFEKYLDWNAEKAWTNRRMTDGLCGVNLLTAPTISTDLASPCSAIGPQLAFYTHLDMDSDFGVDKAQLLTKINEAKAVNANAYSEQSLAALGAEAEKAEAAYNDPYAPSRRIAAAVYRIDNAIGKLRLISHPLPLRLDGINPAAFELEEGVFTDSVNAAAIIPGFSGTGYATGFTTKANSGYSENVSFDVEAATAGRYDLTLRSAVYLKDEAFRKTRSYNYTTGYGHQIDVTDGERDSYWPVGAVNAENPRWLQIDLQKPTEINMVRIRIRNNQASRDMDFSLWGGLDKDNLVELKANRRYSFVRAGTSNATYNNSGNYADVEFDPTTVRYLRAVFTYASSTCEVAEFEAYAPVRTAALYIDGVKAKEFEMPVNAQKLTGATWESGVIPWQDYVIEDVYLLPGSHKIAIVSEGSTPDKYDLDKLTFSAPDLYLKLDRSIVGGKIIGTLENRMSDVYSGALILGIYGNNGRLAYMEDKPFEISSGEAIPFEFSVDAAAYPQAEYVYKVFCWDENYVPLIKSN